MNKKCDRKLGNQETLMISTLAVDQCARQAETDGSATRMSAAASSMWADGVAGASVTRIMDESDRE